MRKLARRHGRRNARARKRSTSERLPDAPTLILAASPAGDARLEGVDEWIAAQKRKAAADLLRRELSTFRETRASTNEDAGPLFRGGR